MEMRLQDIASCLKIPVTYKSDTMVRDVAFDSRNIGKGSLFFALPGSHTDGHLFLDEVRKKGGCAAVVEPRRVPNSFKKADNFLLPVKNTLDALQTVASEYRKRFNIPVVGITGTNGKTTVKEMTAAILGSKYRVCKSMGNYNNHIGVPVSICSWNADCEVAILEIGTNHFGEIQHLCEIARPTHGVITNIGKGHLAYLKDTEGVARAKRELLDSLEKNGKAYLNGDDVILRSFQSIVNHTVMFGFDNSNDFRAVDLGTDENGFPKMQLNGKPVKLSVLGRHNLMNALAAAAISRTFGIPWDDILKVLRHYEPCNKRMERIKIGSVMVLNDTYNANPGSVLEALNTLMSIKEVKRRVVVLGDMLELGAASIAEHENIGKKITELGVDGFFAFGSEMEKAIASAKQAGLKTARHFAKKSVLIEMLGDFIQAEDGVLIKGSRGMQMEDVVDGLKKKPMQ